MMRSLPLVALAMLLSAPAMAQQSTPPAGNNPLSPVAVPVPAPPPAPDPLAKVTPTDATRAQALALAAMLNGEALTRQQLERAYTVTMPAALKQRPDFQQLEAAYPGITDVVIKAERAIVEPATIANLSALHHTVANVYADYLTAGDLDVLIGFYSGSTGAKALQAAAEGTDLSQMIQKNIANPDSSMAGSDVQKMVAGSGPKFLGKLDDADRSRLLVFAMSPTGRKWTRLQPQVFEAVAQLANASKDDLMAKASKNVLDVMAAYIKKADARATHGKTKAAGE